MTLNEMRALQQGDQVQWNDPDNLSCTGVYFIQDISTHIGRIEDYSTVVFIRNAAGHIAEVLASELG